MKAVIAHIAILITLAFLVARDTPTGEKLSKFDYEELTIYDSDETLEFSHYAEPPESAIVLDPTDYGMCYNGMGSGGSGGTITYSPDGEIISHTTYSGDDDWDDRNSPIVFFGAWLIAFSLLAIRPER